MFGYVEMTILIGVLLALVFLGVHLAVALGTTAAVGIYLINGDIDTVRTFVANTAFETLRDYVFAVIPLFMLMGEFLAKCGAARDMFALINSLTRRIPGRLGVATVLANAVFAFVTGVSIAAAAAFSRIAYPEMKRHGYNRQFALGCIAGSACLGMLIPPSVLMIVWGVLTEQSIGKLFLAGVLPGFVLVAFFVAYILWVAVTKPELVGAGPTHAKLTAEMSTREVGQAAWSTMTVIMVVFLTLGGIWLGFFTPTEGAGVGAVLSLVFALMKGMKPRAMFEVVLSVGRTSAPLLLLLFTAQLYSRVLSMTGVTKATQDLFIATGFGPYGVLALMVLIWFVLGCLIDSISIILLTVPVFAPIAGVLGFDPLAFAMIGILAIETGFLTPPFGLVVFTVKAALPEEDTTVGEIFKGSTPYWVCLLGVIVCIVFFPGIATWLPELSTKVIVGN